MFGPVRGSHVKIPRRERARRVALLSRLTPRTDTANSTSDRAIRFFFLAGLTDCGHDLKDLTQRMMLSTWLAEFYLSKCNELDDLAASSSASYDVENVKAEQMMLEEDLRHFFKTYKVRISL